MFKKILIILVVIFLPLASQAATLYFDPAAGQYGSGDTFGVNIRINTDKSECINAIEATVDFPNDLLQIEDFSTGDSILNLWIAKPEKAQMEKINQDGSLYFAGGVPGGYCGQVPGDPGESDIIGQIFFKVPDDLKLSADKKGKVIFSADTKILLNDGLGTSAKLVTNEGEYMITAKPGEGKKEWADKLKEDNLQPEPFTVELSKDDAIFDGKYFIMFSTTDKQTGVDHYQVMEIKLADLVKENQKRTWLDLILRKNYKQAWLTANSPYLLKDQNLGSLIRVKAVDKAGNERMVEFTPTEGGQLVEAVGGKESNLNIYLIIGIILILMITLMVVKKLRRKYEENINS